MDIDTGKNLESTSTKRIREKGKAMTRIPTNDVLTESQVDRINEEVMRILSEVGVEFGYDPAVEVLKAHGCKVDGQRVYFDRRFVEDRIAEAPSSFTFKARDDARSTFCGDGSFILTPSYGPPFVYELDGTRRSTGSEDYRNIIKLCHMSENINHTGHNVVEMIDYPDPIRHLKMLEAHIKYSDKPFMGASHGTVCAKDTVEMCKILYGMDDDAIRDTPIVNTLINSITPLKYDERMLGALMTYAEYGQANMISALVMSGSTGPVTMVETLAVQLAENLAGLCLAECIRPGSPVIIGSTSGPADMASMALSIGNSEVALYTSATAQMGRFYDVPVRGGGGLNDAILTDAQAGYESMLTLLTAGTSGVAFVLHAAGIMHYYNAFSYEMFVIADEIAGLCNKYLKGYDFDEDRFLFDDVMEVGPGGHFLYQDSTLDYLDEHRRPLISNRADYEIWEDKGSKSAAQVAHDRWTKQLEEYVAPEMDATVLKELDSFIDRRCNELIGSSPEPYTL